MAANRSRVIALNCAQVEAQSESAQAHGRLGGAPLLPENFEWPKDRTGAPMVFVAQIDFGRLPTIDVSCPARGMLSVFRSRDILTMPSKDRRAFHFSFLPDFTYENLHLTAPLASQPASEAKNLQPLWLVTTSPSWSINEAVDSTAELASLSAETKTAMKRWIDKFNSFSCGKNRILGADLQGAKEQKEICAFAASGISHSPERAKDWHYSHLIDEVPQWILLANFEDGELFSRDREESGRAIKNTRLFIRREDLAQALFERAWLICS